MARHTFKYLKFLVKLHHASVTGYILSVSFLLSRGKKHFKVAQEMADRSQFSFHKVHFFSSECELMLKKVGAILMLLYLAHSFLGPRIGWFQKPLLARSADA